MTRTIELGGDNSPQPITIQFKMGPDPETPNSGIYVVPSDQYNVKIDETTKVHIVRVAGRKENLVVPDMGFMTRLVVSSVTIDGPRAMATLVPEFVNNNLDSIGLTIIGAHFVVNSDIGLSLVLPGESYLVTVDCSEAMRPQPVADVPEDPQTEEQKIDHPEVLQDANDPVADNRNG